MQISISHKHFEWLPLMKIIQNAPSAIYHAAVIIDANIATVI
jgi:hypothetical protein